MINFPRSSFTWKSHPKKADRHYKWMGGFVGEQGEYYHVRFTLEAGCKVTEEATGKSAELFLGAPCRSEYTIARRNLFQIPSGEWRMAFSRRSNLTIARLPSTETEPASARSLVDGYQDFRIDIREYPEVEELTDIEEIVKATLNNDVLSARSTYRNGGFAVTVEYPVKVMNIHQAGAQFQVCTGPVLLPDLATWNGEEIERVFVAQVAISDFDFVEFILRREVDAAPEDRDWLDRPRGRDRLELINPEDAPKGYPPARPRPLVYNETWEFDAQNAILRAAESQRD